VNAERSRFCRRIEVLIGKGSIRAFARRAGISERTLRKYLAGESEPTRPVLIRIATAGRVNIHWLATGDGPMRLLPRSGYERPAPAAPTFLGHLDPADLPREELKVWIDDWWARASEKERIWFEVEMGRLFPGLEQWRKSQRDGP